MVRFIHTADWQIGMKAVHVGAAGDRVRAARLDAARNVVEAARRNDASFILLAGDTFEDNAVDRVLVQRVVDTLRSSPVPVFVLPGNHDPLVPGSILESEAFASAGSRVRVLRTSDPVEVAGAVLFPCPLRAKHGRSDPTSTIPKERGATIRVGLAHGTLRAAGVEADDDFPIEADAAEVRGLDYLALGHWHSYFTAKSADGAVRAAYSGTHEQTKFGEEKSGHALVVTIERPGAAPRLEPIRTGLLRWEHLTRDLHSPGDVDRLVRDLDRVSEPDRTLIAVTLRGALPAAGLASLARIEDLLKARFLFGRLDASTVTPSPTDESWVDELPPGPPRAAARRLLAIATGGEVDAAAPRVVAREALARLYALAKGPGS